MSTWPDTDGAAIDRYVGQLRLRHPRARRIYRSELLRFQRFIEEHGELSLKSVTEWVRARAARWPLDIVFDRACKADRLLDFLVAEGTLPSQPFAQLRSRSGLPPHWLSPIIRALLAQRPQSALVALRRLPRFGSFLGSMMQEHIELRRALGYRYKTQAERLAALDRFLQRRPDLRGSPLPVLIREWESAAVTLEQRWTRQLAGRDLAKAWRRLDPTVPPLLPDRSLKRRIQAARRRPYIYTHRQVQQLLHTARALHSPRAPLRSLTLYTMLVVGYCAGLRISELIRLDLGEISWEAGTITIRESKFHKSRRLPLTESALSALRDYLHARAKAGGATHADAPLFWREYPKGGGRYARVTVTNLLVRILRRAGFKPEPGRRGPRIHDLRHSFVAHRMLRWYRDGVNPQAHLPYLATFLGHSDINSTLVYLNASPELLQLASERFRSYVQRAYMAEGRRA